jgi:hypothetical protein
MLLISWGPLNDTKTNKLWPYLYYNVLLKLERANHSVMNDKLKRLVEKETESQGPFCTCQCAD